MKEHRKPSPVYKCSENLPVFSRVPVCSIALGNYAWSNFASGKYKLAGLHIFMNFNTLSLWVSKSILSTWHLMQLFPSICMYVSTQDCMNILNKSQYHKYRKNVFLSNYNHQYLDVSHQWLVTIITYDGLKTFIF